MNDKIKELLFLLIQWLFFAILILSYNKISFWWFLLWIVPVVIGVRAMYKIATEEGKVK